MTLYCDALACTGMNVNAIKCKLKKNILKKIEDDLDIEEKISILFLMIDDYTCGFKDVYYLLEKYKEYETYILKAFIDNHENNWENKLLEAICIIQNRQVIRKLGLLFDELELLYFPKIRLCARHINPIAKCLYFLCENLTQNDTMLLLQYVKSDFNEYEENLKDTDCLELHILYWLQEKHISFHKGRVNLKNLLRHMKTFDDIALIYEDFKKMEDHQSVLDVQNISSYSTPPLKFSVTEGTQLLPVGAENDIKRLKKGLCIIISQMSFLGEKFETRFGTAADCRKLSETFKGFGFAVSIFKNLKKDEILKTLEDIPEAFGTNYDCLFLCILSHGCKGGIISSDEQEVSLDAIEHKICCEKLMNVIKIVIVQACQGQATGLADEALTTDGRTNNIISNIFAYRNFCIFMSTMQGFVSVRHKEEGSWFIQEFCNVLQNEGSEITFMKATNKIIQGVMKKRGKIYGRNAIAQLPELRTYRLVTDFQFPEYRPEIAKS
ncbi:caspase-8 Dredd [Nomia melanderi]|uniref:caspase-8 Dredd n=1 Tax=Nomia melanderi TaxID=2448451 RepID=UPI003FCD437C